MSESGHTSRGQWALWLAIAIPAALQLALLVYTMMSRLAFPYDLEWMEGGLLAHADRIDRGLGIYVAPSIDFIPYLYTPLYPGILAVLGKLFGISYPLGRAISVASALGVVVIAGAAVARQREPGTSPATAAGALLAGGLWAATYPFVDGWYDLVRADTLFVAMAVGGLAGVSAWARAPGVRGLVKLGGAALVLGLSFYCKQTGVMFVAIGGAIVLVKAWRRVPLYVAITGVVGAGGTALLSRATGGWFWTYIYQVHQIHDFNIDRVWASFGNILWQFPAMTIAIAVGLVAVAAAAIARRSRPAGSSALLTWAPVFAASTVIGAISWGTQWAHFNAYMPAMATGAIAAGAAVPAVLGALGRLRPRSWLAPAGAGAVAAAIALQLAVSLWRPARFIPTDADRAAGDALIAHLRRIDGDVFVPYHPWYAHLAGKPLHTHRMGLLDMTYGGRWQIAGMSEAMARHRFAAIVLDNRPVRGELIGVREHYQRQSTLPPEEQPRVYSGAGGKSNPAEAPLYPHEIWVPRAR